MQTSVSLCHTDEKSFCTKEIIKASQVPVMPTHPSPENVPEPKDSQGPETEWKFRQEGGLPSSSTVTKFCG